jgi:hypothetical protein
MSCKAAEKSVLVTRHNPWATGSLLLLAFLFWLLNHPYQGIWHDARVYGLIAAHWIYPEALAHDLFFRFGSQGSLSLFTPIYGELVRALGLDLAARLVVLTGGLLWCVALFALARTLLGDTLAGRFAVLFGVMLSVSYSPNASVFVLNENFATARSWAMPVGLLAVALLAAGKTRWAVGLALLSCLLHPLLGIWPLALVIFMRLQLRWTIQLTLLPILLVIGVGLLNPDVPHLRLMQGEWLDYLSAASDILFKPLGENRLPVYFTALAGLLAGTRVGSPQWRPLYARLLALAVGGLVLALLAAYGLPLEIVVQGQPWRVFWLTIPLASMALLDVIQRTAMTDGVPLLIGSGLALLAIDDEWLLPLIWLVCTASWLPVHYLNALAAHIGSWRKALWVMMLVLYLLALPGLIVELEIAGARFVTPWWPGALVLHGLVAGSLWPLPLLLAWLLGRQHPASMPGVVFVAVVAVTGLLILVLGSWDKRPLPVQHKEARYLNSHQPSHPFSTYIRRGETVAWPEQEMTVWLDLHTASYWGKTQGIGVVFSHDKFAEWQRRGALVAAAPSRLALCADRLLDWVVVMHPLTAVTPVAVAPSGAALYACRPQVAVLPSAAARSTSFARPPYGAVVLSASDFPERTN